MRIITRGFGTRQMLVTRGYGRSILERIYREVLKLTTVFTTTLKATTAFGGNVKLATSVTKVLKVISGFAMATIENIKLNTSFTSRINLSQIMEIGKSILSTAFTTIKNIVLSCSFNLFKHDK